MKRYLITPNLLLIIILVYFLVHSTHSHITTGSMHLPASWQTYLIYALLSYIFLQLCFFVIGRLTKEGFQEVLMKNGAKTGYFSMVVLLHGILLWIFIFATLYYPKATVLTGLTSSTFACILCEYLLYRRSGMQANISN
jgi:hypothetical protein